MATMAFWTGVNMLLDTQWFGLVSEKLLTRLTIYDGFHSAAYYGYGLTYGTNDEGDTFFETGTVTDYREYENGRMTIEITGMEVSALMVPTANDPLYLFYEAILQGKDTVIGSSEADFLSGFNGNDTISGNAGKDLILGGSGRDVINGNGGRDLVSGNDGNDRLYGDGKADILVGGFGADRMTGGTQSDHFVFDYIDDSTPNRMDTVTDFTTGDRIDLKRIDADTDAPDDQRFKFIGDADFTDAGQVRFENRVLQADVDGDGVADFAVRLIGVDALTKADFIL